MKSIQHLITLIIFIQNILSETPVFMNLPLDIHQYHSIGNDMSTIFAEMAKLQVTGVTFDVWWGRVEKSPNQYDFSFYRDLLKLAIQYKLKVQFTICFHGAHPNNNLFIDLPSWLQSSEKENFYFTNNENNTYPLYISLFADNKKIFPGQNGLRSPLQIYEDFAIALKSEFQNEIGVDIVNIIIGLGPNGQLRYPTHRPQLSDFCKEGEFQCFDDYALQNAKENQIKLSIDEVCEVQMFGPKEDCGRYGMEQSECHQSKCCWQPNQKGEPWCFHKKNFALKNYNVSEKFLQWYHTSLIQHGDSILNIFRQVFPNKPLAFKVPSIHWKSPDNRQIPEIHSGLINKDNYDDIFQIAQKNKASIVFGGIGLDEFVKCNSNPEHYIDLFKQKGKQYEVNIIGENPHDISRWTKFELFKRDAIGMHSISILRYQYNSFKEHDYDYSDLVKEFIQISKAQIQVTNQSFIQIFNKKKKIRKIYVVEIMKCKECLQSIENHF